MNQDPNATPEVGRQQERPIELPPMRPIKGTSSRVGGCGRWAAYGCLGGIVVLALFLFVSFFTIKRGLLWTAVRGCQQVERNLPDDMTPMERARLMNNFDRLLAELRRMEDPNPILGRFLGMVARVLEDDAVSFEEAEEINAFVEAEFPEEPTPPPARTPPAIPTAAPQSTPVADTLVELPRPE